MNLNSKYTTESEKTKPENKDKKVLTDDAFAVCEFLEELNNSIERVKLSLT